MTPLFEGYTHIGQGAEVLELTFLERTEEAWGRIWELPVAEHWTDGHLPQLERWAVLTDLFNRGHAKYNTEIRQLEGQLGMSWEVEQRLGMGGDSDSGPGSEPGGDDGGDFDERFERAIR